MIIDTEHLHYWMQAIRQSNDPMRTMDSFWSGQLKSKEWLIDCLDEHVHFASSIDIHGGWVGVLASMIFQSNIPVTTIRSIDIDPSCESIATMMNKGEEIDGRFKAITGDMCTVPVSGDVIVNTSCEHIEKFSEWFEKIPDGTILALQTNNFNDLEEHVRISENIGDFSYTAPMSQTLYMGKLELPKYTRFMKIGIK